MDKVGNLIKVNGVWVTPDKLIEKKLLSGKTPPIRKKAPITIKPAAPKATKTTLKKRVGAEVTKDPLYNFLANKILNPLARTPLAKSPLARTPLARTPFDYATPFSVAPIVASILSKATTAPAATTTVPANTPSITPAATVPAATAPVGTAPIIPAGATPETKALVEQMLPSPSNEFKGMRGQWAENAAIDREAIKRRTEDLTPPTAPDFLDVVGDAAVALRNLHITNPKLEQTNRFTREFMIKAIDKAYESAGHLDEASLAQYKAIRESLTKPSATQGTAIPLMETAATTAKTANAAISDAAAERKTRNMESWSKLLTALGTEGIQARPEILDFILKKLGVSTIGETPGWEDNGLEANDKVKQVSDLL